MHRTRNTALAGFGVLALTLASGAARSEVTSTVSIVSDYNFRGITQTARDPAFQASLDWSGESGLYAGLWGSNIDFGTYVPEDATDPEQEESLDLNIELDFILGYANSFTEKLSYDVGGVYYKYLGGDNGGVNDFDYPEIYAGLSYTVFSGALSPKVWYSWDSSNSGLSAWYVELNFDYPLPAELGLILHYGHSSGDYWDDSYDGGYSDFAVGLARSFGHFDFEVKYIDGSDLAAADCARVSVECGSNHAFSSESIYFAGVSTTFPWSSDE